MLIHAFVVFCLALNPTMCREQEIIRADYTYAASVTDCAIGGISYGGTGFTDRDGAAWIVKGVRCRTEGALPTTAMQQQLRAAFERHAR